VNRKGFTLVELMVVMTILGVVVVGVLGLVTRQNKAYHSEESIIDMQMNARVAMDRIVHIIRMAGFGCQKNISNGVNGFTTVITATNNTTAPDSLTVVSGLRKVGVVDNDNDPTNGSFSKTTTTVIPVKMDGSLTFTDYFNDSNKRYFYISPAISKGFFTVTSGGVDDTNKKLTKTGGGITIREGNNVYAVRAYTLAINSGNVTINENTGGGNQIYVENIEDLQFQYGWDQNGDGQFDPNSEWADDPSGNEDQVRAVKVYLLARSGQPDRDFIDLHDDDAATAGKQYTIADHTITLNSSSEHFHHYLAEATVLIRNLNF
jgi:prepilin-type N-terminal cleavage/methylation domain-containing protein